MRVKTYLQRKNKTDLGVTNADFETQALNNWSAQSVAVLLGWKKARYFKRIRQSILQ
jgi:hypothetical protein